MTVPRLADLDPKLVTIETDSWPGTLPTGALSSSVQRYALGELPWTVASVSWDALVRQLYSGAHPETSHAGDRYVSRQREPQYAIDVVLMAAHARRLLETGQPVPLAHLAALGSVSYQWLRKLAARGGLKTGRGGVPVAEARRWLRERGVAGV